MIYPNRRLVSLLACPRDPVLLDTTAIALALGVKPALVRQWARRGKLIRRGSDARGRTLYDLGEAYRVHAQMRRGSRAPREDFPPASCQG